MWRPPPPVRLSTVCGSGPCFASSSASRSDPPRASVEDTAARSPSAERKAGTRCRRRTSLGAARLRAARGGRGLGARPWGVRHRAPRRLGAAQAARCRGGSGRFPSARCRARRPLVARRARRRRRPARPVALLARGGGRRTARAADADPHASRQPRRPRSRSGALGCGLGRHTRLRPATRGPALGGGAIRRRAAPAGLGFIAQGPAEDGHDLDRLPRLSRRVPGRRPTPYLSGEAVAGAVRAAAEPLGWNASERTLTDEHVVGYDETELLEGYLRRCIFDRGPTLDPDAPARPCSGPTCLGVATTMPVSSASASP